MGLSADGGDSEREAVLVRLQHHIMTQPQLTTPDEHEPLKMYQKAIKQVVCALTTMAEGKQHAPIRYTIKLLTQKESKLSPIRKLSLALGFGCRRMKPYLYQHHVTVVTSSLMKLSEQPISSITGVSDLAGKFDDPKINFALRKDGDPQPP